VLLARHRIPEPLRHLDEAWERMRFCMVKLHQCWTAFEPSGALVHEVAEWCAKRKIPLFAHLYSARDVHAYFDVIRERPQTFFILAHCIDVRVIGPKPHVDNLFFDISPPDLVGMWQIRKALDIVGPEHVLLGSDTPYGRRNLQRNIARVRSLGLSAAETDAILGNNLAALLGIAAAHHA
jgi:predicted TIM-barrel fold metal-dependent hydrolase